MNSSPALVASVTPFPMKRKIAAILAADVVGYSRLVAEDEEWTLGELGAARQIFDAQIARVGGRIFNTAGDSVMVEFDSAVEALRAAVEIQSVLTARNRDIEPRRRLEFRMGLTIGDVVERDGDLLGDGVNIAARLEGLAPAGGICVSRSVHEAVFNKLSVTFRELGPRQVKNIPQPVHAYLIEPPGGGSGAARGLTVEPIVARRRKTERAAPRPEAEDTKRRGGGLLRATMAALALVALVFLGAPAVELARTSVENWRQERPPAAPPTTAPETAKPGEKPPSNESGGPTTPPARPQGQPERPATAPPTGPGTPSTAGTAPPPALRPTKVERPRPAQKETPGPEASKPETKPEAPKPESAKPESAKPETPRPEAARPERPSDPTAAFAGMAREGLIPDARTLAEHYHNARFLEARNDRTGALAAYAAAAPLAGDYVDVHVRYGALLRAVRGAGGVRQTYAPLAKSASGPAADLVLAMSYEGEERRTKLQALASAHPNVAAIDHLLADALLDGRDGGPTLTDRRLAFDAGERFLEAAADGELNARFVDRSFLDGWLDQARRRRGDIERFFSSGQTRPNVAFTRVSSGWLAKLTLPEPASAVAVRIGERGEFTSTGFSSTPDARTGKPLPRLEFEMPANTPRATLYLTYQDRSGREAGPFPLAFDPGTANVDAGRTVLERFPDSWVAFREDLPDVLSFATLAGNRCSLSKAVVGFGDEPPRRVLPLPPCEGGGSGPAAGNALISIPDGTDTVQVQLVFADGTESPVRTFKRP